MRFWNIVQKDIILLVRDSRALFVLVVFPLVFITIIGLTTGKLLGWKNENQILKIGVIDKTDYDALEDETDRRKAHNMAMKIVNGVRSGKNQRGEMLEAGARFQESLENGNLDAVLEIGPEFYGIFQTLEPEDASSSGSGALRKGLAGLGMTLHSNLPETSGTRSVIEQLLFDQALKTVLPYVLCDKFHTSNVMVNVQIQRKLNCQKLRTEVVELRAPSEESTVSAGGDDMLYTVLIPSYTVMFVFFLINIMARSFLQERDLGTLRRLRFAPISDPGLVAGKTLPFLLISLVQTGLLFVSGKLLFGMIWGPVPWMLIPVICATSLSATSLGLLVATIVRSDSQVSAYANIIVISMAGFSGCFMPRAWLPGPMQNGSLIFPHAWALMAYEQLLVKAAPDLGLVWQYCGVLMLFSAVCFAAGCWRFRYYD